MYILIHNEHGKYVAKPGSEHSYTRDLANARKFQTAEEADNDRCRDCEHACHIESLIN